MSVAIAPGSESSGDILSSGVHRRHCDAWSRRAAHRLHVELQPNDGAMTADCGGLRGNDDKAKWGSLRDAFCFSGILGGRIGRGRSAHPEPRVLSMVRQFLIRTLATVSICSAAGAQIPPAEYAARRDSLAARIDSGVVVAFGGRTPVTDFGPFYQLPAFHYLTNFDEPDAAFLMVVRRGHGASTMFLTPAEPRAAFYYGWRPDSAA